MGRKQPSFGHNTHPLEPAQQLWIAGLSTAHAASGGCATDVGPRSYSSCYHYHCVAVAVAWSSTQCGSCAEILRYWEFRMNILAFCVYSEAASIYWYFGTRQNIPELTERQTRGYMANQAHCCSLW